MQGGRQGVQRDGLAMMKEGKSVMEGERERGVECLLFCGCNKVRIQFRK